MAKEPGSHAAKDKSNGPLKKATDRPIGEPDRAREEAPIGWDFGPEGQAKGPEPDEAEAGQVEPSSGGGGPIDDAGDDMGADATGAASSEGDAEAGPEPGGGGDVPSESEPVVVAAAGDEAGDLDAPVPGIPEGSTGDVISSGGSPSPRGPSPSAVGDGPAPVDVPEFGGVTPSEPGGGTREPESPDGGETGWVPGPPGEVPGTGGPSGGGTGPGGGDAGTGGGAPGDGTGPGEDGSGPGGPGEVPGPGGGDTGGGGVGVVRPPEISGPAADTVQEDVILSVSGQLAASGSGDMAWSLVGPGLTPNGSFALGPDGIWSYALDNDAAQGFKAGETAQDIFTVKVTDANGASVTQTVTVTIVGTNDAPVIAGTAAGAVEEDAVSSVSGVLTATDVDIGDDATWSLAGTGEGSQGTLILGEDGQWSYMLDNDAAQGLRAGETAQDLFTVTVTDTAGASVTQVITVTVTGTNDAPVISGAGTGMVEEDGSLSTYGLLTAVDTDIGDTATWSIIGSGEGEYGSLVLGEDGTWSYTLDNEAAQSLRASYAAQEIFAVRVTDASGASAMQTVTVTVTGVNDAPGVISGAATGYLQEDKELDVGGVLQSADADIGDTASWSVVGDGAGRYGSFTLDQDGNWSYALDNDSVQGLRVGDRVQEIFTVKVTDSAGASDTQTVTIIVTGTNDAPVISGTETGSVGEDGTLAADGRLAVTDPDIGDTADWSLVGSSAGSYGALVLGDDGQWSYTLDNDAAQGLKEGETAQEIFTVTVTDASGATDIRTVTITVTGTNDVPVISGTETGTVGEDGTLTAGGLLTVTDPDIGDSPTWSLASGSEGSYGGLVLGEDGAWSYALDNDAAQGLKAGEAAQEIFTVNVTDASGASDIHTITITVTGTNDSPVISGTETGAVGEDDTLTADGALKVTDPDIGDSATWSLIGSSEGGYGALALGDDGHWSYVLDNDAAQGLKAGETAQEVFTVKVTDASGASDTQTVTITVTGTNDAPVISGTKTGAVSEDGTLTAGGSLTSTDPDIGDNATWSLVGGSEGSYGGLVLGEDGTWSYALDNDAAQGLKEGQTAQEIFTVRVSDASGASDTQTVTITVTGTNDVPVISGATTGFVQEDEIPSVSGAFSSSDPDIGDSAAWSIVGSDVGHYGNLVLGSDGAWTYTLDDDAAQGLKAGDSAQEIFTIKVTDASGASATQTVTVTVQGTNDAPVISGSTTGTVGEDGIQTASGALTGTDVDVGDTAAWSIVGGEIGAYGRLALGDDGRWSYALDNDAAQGLKAGETAQEIFTVKVTDTSGASALQTIAISVTGANDVPAISGVATGAVQEDGALTVGGSLTVSDADIGDMASWSVVGDSAGAYGDLTLGTDGQWSYALDNDAAQGLKAGETAQEIFTVKVTDASGASDTQTVTVTVTGTNDAPVISGTATGLVEEDGTLTAGGKLDVFDADTGDTAAWSVVGGEIGAFGVLSIDESGRWTYALDNDKAQGLKRGETAQETFTVRVTDAAGATAEQTIIVTVGGTNDMPVISGTSTGQVQEDVTLTASGTLAAADVDIGDTTNWSVEGSTTTEHGVFAIDPDTGQWTYTLDNDSAQGLKTGETIRETFTVRATDSAGASQTHLVSVEITGTNDRPQVGQALNNMGSMKEDSSITFSAEDLLRGAKVTDIDQDNLSITSVGLDGSSAPGMLVDNHDGTWTFTPDHNVSNANAQIVFQVSDGHMSVSAQASVAIQPVADPADVSISSSAIQEVIKTGDADDLGRIVAPQLTTKQLPEFTLEFTVVGDSVPESTTGQGPVIVNIGSPPSDKNTLTLWDPANMKVGMSKVGGGDINIPTGIDLTDGESHRVTVTYDGKANTLKVYDNGDLALTTQLPKPLPSTLYMSVAEKANTPPTTSNPSGGGYRASEHFEGTIYNVAMSNKAETAEQVKDAPLAEQMEDNLLIDLRAQDGKIVDTTGRNSIKTAGDIDTDAVSVDTNLGSAPAGSVVRLDIDAGLTDPNDHITSLVVSGFIAGTVVSDGVHSVTVTGPTQKIDIADWSLDTLTADLPDGVHTSMDLKVTATTRTPPYETGAIGPQGEPVLATDSATSDEHHILMVEGAGPPPPLPPETEAPSVIGPDGELPETGETVIVPGDEETGGSTSEEAPQGGQPPEEKPGIPETGDGTTTPSPGDGGSDETGTVVGPPITEPPATDTVPGDGGETQPGTTEPPTTGDGGTGTIPPETTEPPTTGTEPGDGGTTTDPSAGGETGTVTEPPPSAGGGDTGTIPPETTEPPPSTGSGDTGTLPPETTEPPTTGTEPGDGGTTTGPSTGAETGAVTEPPTTGTEPGDGGTVATPPVVNEPVDASGNITLVTVNDWYNPSWGGGYNATFQLTLTDEMLKDGSLEGWSLKIDINNPNATVSTGWLDGFNGTVAFDPSTGVFTNAGQDYQPELHAGDVIQFSIQVQNTGFHLNDFSFSFQDLDPVPAGAAEATTPAVASAMLEADNSADAGDVSAVSLSGATDWSDMQDSAAPGPAEAQPSAAAAPGQATTGDEGRTPGTHIADSHAAPQEVTVDHGAAPAPHQDAALSADTGQATFSHSTADPYLQFVQPPDEDHAVAASLADDGPSSASDYLHMAAAGDDQHVNQGALGQEPPPDQLFADAQVEHGPAGGVDHDAEQQAMHDDASAVAAAQEPVTTEDDQSHHHGQ
jgi:VCBS repeat-containing protein